MSEHPNEELKTTKDQATQPISQEVSPLRNKQERTIDLNDIKCGYIVAVTTEGDFIFNTLGKEKGILEILGLHTHASVRINQLHGKRQIFGDTLVNEVGKGVAILNEKVGKLIELLAPRQPDNQIEPR